MPKSPKRPCRYPGCPNLCESGTYCPEHSAESPDRMRGSAAERGYGADWRKARKQFLGAQSAVQRLHEAGRADARNHRGSHHPASGRSQVVLGRNKLAAPLQALPR